MLKATDLTARDTKVRDLDHYPNGTWAQLHDVNDFGPAPGYWLGFHDSDRSGD